MWILNWVDHVALLIAPKIAMMKESDTKIDLQTSRYEELHQTQAIKLKKANGIHLMIQRPTSFWFSQKYSSDVCVLEKSWGTEQKVFGEI